MASQLPIQHAEIRNLSKTDVAVEKSSPAENTFFNSHGILH
jgi:hypothetical protein